LKWTAQPGSWGHSWTRRAWGMDLHDCRRPTSGMSASRPGTPRRRLPWIDAGTATGREAVESNPRLQYFSGGGVKRRDGQTAAQSRGGGLRTGSRTVSPQLPSPGIRSSFLPKAKWIPTIHNLCGNFGAHLAGLLQTLAGVGSWLVPAYILWECIPQEGPRWHRRLAWASLAFAVWTVLGAFGTAECGDRAKGLPTIPQRWGGWIGNACWPTLRRGIGSSGVAHRPRRTDSASPVLVTRSSAYPCLGAAHGALVWGEGLALV